MRFLALIISSLCLISVTGSVELYPDANDEHDVEPENLFPDVTDKYDEPEQFCSDATVEPNALEPEPRNSKVSNFIYGDLPLFTEVIPIMEPDLVQCAFRRQRGTFLANDTSYLVSKRFPEYVSFDKTTKKIVPRVYTWLEAREECRKSCMELVSLDTWEKFKTVALKMKQYKIDAIWTSGRLCDFKGCQKTNDIEGLRKRGWIWVSTRLPPTDKVPFGYQFNPWDDYGSLKIPQPDNAELQSTGKRESCIAFMRSFDGGYTRLHDLACHHRNEFFCEESLELMKFMQKKYSFDLSSKIPIVE